MCVLNDITERRRAELALQAAGVELARRNEDLERFTEILAHHLQEPVRIQHIYAQRLAALLPTPTPPDLRAAIDAITDGAMHQRNLLRDALRYLSLNKGETAPQTCDIGAALALACNGETGKPDFLEAAVDGLPMVAMSVKRLAGIFAALLDNASTYRDPGRPLKVTITGEPRESGVFVAVTDNGIGIPPQYRSRVFLVFERLDRSTTQQTGIGLALVKKAVEGAGGQVWADDPGGIGTRICLLLPISAPMEQTA